MIKYCLNPSKVSTFSFLKVWIYVSVILFFLILILKLAKWSSKQWQTIILSFGLSCRWRVITKNITSALFQTLKETIFFFFFSCFNDNSSFPTFSPLGRRIVALSTTKYKFNILFWLKTKHFSILIFLSPNLYILTL